MALAALLLLAACANDEPAPDPVPAPDTIPFREDGRLTFLAGDEPIIEIAIEIADSDSAMMRGMMQRQAFPENSGMLFVFPVEEEQGFWMANTPLSLDLVFVNADSQVVHVAKYTRPLSDETIPSIDPAQYVVEVPAGFADTYGITEATRVRWRRAPRTGS